MLNTKVAPPSAGVAFNLLPAGSVIAVKREKKV